VRGVHAGTHVGWGWGSQKIRRNQVSAEARHPRTRTRCWRCLYGGGGRGIRARTHQPRWSPIETIWGGRPGQNGTAGVAGGAWRRQGQSRNRSHQTKVHAQEVAGRRNPNRRSSNRCRRNPNRRSTNRCHRCRRSRKRRIALAGPAGRFSSRCHHQRVSPCQRGAGRTCRGVQLPNEVKGDFGGDCEGGKRRGSPVITGWPGGCLGVAAQPGRNRERERR
jgi:hypothetical protein